MTATVATGAGDGEEITPTVATPTFPSLVALIAAEPLETAVTRPEEDTVATVGAELDHEMIRSVTMVPVESFTTAVTCVVLPIWSEAAASDTDTDPTGTALTTIDELAAMLSAVATTLALPIFNARTSPESETTTVSVSELIQLT